MCPLFVSALPGCLSVALVHFLLVGLKARTQELEGKILRTGQRKSLLLEAHASLVLFVEPTLQEWDTFLDLLTLLPTVSSSVSFLTQKIAAESGVAIVLVSTVNRIVRVRIIRHVKKT